VKVVTVKAMRKEGRTGRRVVDVEAVCDRSEGREGLVLAYTGAGIGNSGFVEAGLHKVNGSQLCRAREERKDLENVR
jgi:hypothetical protein